MDNLLQDNEFNVDDFGLNISKEAWFHKLDTSALKKIDINGNPYTPDFKLSVPDGTSINLHGDMNIRSDDSGEEDSKVFTIEKETGNAVTEGHFHIKQDLTVDGKTDLGLLEVENIDVTNQLQVYGDSKLYGNLEVTGTLKKTTIETKITQMKDPLVEFAYGNTNDMQNIGIYAGYREDENGDNKYTSLYRDSGTKKWNLIKDTSIDTSGNNVITGGIKDTLVSNYEGTSLQLTNDNTNGADISEASFKIFNDDVDKFSIDSSGNTHMKGSLDVYGAKTTLKSERAITDEEDSEYSNKNDDALKVSGNVVIEGDLTCIGTQRITTIKSNITQMTDPFIELAHGNTSDTSNIGIYGKYKNDGNLERNAAFYRSHTDKKWYLKNESEIILGGEDNNINNEIESGEKATLVANYEGTEINLTDDVEKQQAAGININDGYCEIRNNGDIISKGDLNIGSEDYLNFRVESSDGSVMHKGDLSIGNNESYDNFKVESTDGTLVTNGNIFGKGDLNIGVGNYESFRVNSQYGHVNFKGDLCIGNNDTYNNFKLDSNNGNIFGKGDLNIGLENYGNFKVNSIDGSIDSKGDLKIGNNNVYDKFKVESNTGNIFTNGTISVNNEGEFNSRIDIKTATETEHTIVSENTEDEKISLNVTGNTALHGDLILNDKWRIRVTEDDCLQFLMKDKDGNYIEKHIMKDLE